MEWKETGKILKMKWEDVIFLKRSKWAHSHSYHKASGSRAVYSKLREIMKKKSPLKELKYLTWKWDFHLEKVRNVDFGIDVLIGFGSTNILLSAVCNIYKICKINYLIIVYQ